MAGGGAPETLFVIGVDGAGVPAARGGDVKVTGVDGRGGKGINGDDDPVHRFALRVLTGDGVVVGKVAEIPPQGAAIGKGDMSVDRYRFDRDQFAIDQGFFAVGGFAVAPGNRGSGCKNQQKAICLHPRIPLLPL